MNANFSCAPLLPCWAIFQFVCIGVFALAAIAPARAQQPDFKALAAQAAHAVEYAKASSVVVLDFVGPDTYVSKLGRNLADQFSASLAAAGGQFEVVNRAKLQHVIEHNRFAPEIVADPEIAAWLAGEAGAKAGIAGQLSPEPGSVRLTINCFRVQDGTITGSYRVSYPSTAEWASWSGQNIDADQAVPPAAGSKGTPSCMVCPAPDVSHLTPGEYLHGTVTILVLVGRDGRARDFRVVQALSHGLTLAAVQAVQKWTFNPGKGPDGKPIDVRVPIEIAFR